MKASTPIEKLHGRYLPWAVGSAAFIGLAGTLFALSEVLENDSDGDGWTDAEEIIAGTNPADATEPWDSDGDGIADYLEFLDGTDPLGPNDPPQARGASVMMNAVAPINDDSSTNILSLPAPTWSSQQNMWHNTAWFGKRLNYTFFRPAADSKWKAINGNEIEYWSTGYYDLLARNGSSGIAITVENVPAGKYTLKWKHMQRPDGGSPGYTVSVSGAATASKRFTAPKTNSEGEIHEASLTFEVSERGTLVLSFDAGRSGTSGPLVGSIALREAITVSEVNLNAGDGGTEFSVTQDSGAAFTGSDWVLSRARQVNPVAFQSGSKLKLVPTFRLPDSTVPARIQAQVTLGNSTNTYTLAWSERGNGIEIPAPVPAGTVGYFENATIVWKVSYDANSDTWEDVGTSTHEIYFTRAAPQAGLAQETLFWVACSACHGKSTDEDIVAGIWSKFSDGSGPANLCRRDGTPMKYWGEEALQRKSALSYADPNSGALDTVQELIKFSDGQCIAWSMFFMQCLNMHCIIAEEVGVEPSNPQDLAFLIKNQAYEEVNEEGSHGGNEYTYALYSSKEEYQNFLCFDVPATYAEIGIPGQGNIDPISVFRNHSLVYCSNIIYDPSYGRKGSVYETLDAALLEWSQNAIVGFQATSSVIIQCSGVSNDTYEVIGRPAVRKPQNGILEIKRINP